MTLQEQLSLSYYNKIGEINEEHKISIVQHRENKNIYVKKELDVYNLGVYTFLKDKAFRGLPKIYEVVESGNTLIVIEEYISGSTLESLLATNGALPEHQIVKYTLQLCDILKNLHNCNPPIIHRDIKPSNIMITPNDDVILLDLNAAKYMNPQTEEDTKLIGTKGYAAPEQYGFGSSNTRTDIYAIGMVINTMLVGSFSNSTIESKLSSIIRKCTELTPQNRFESIEELQKAIQALDVSKPIEPIIQSKSWLTYLPPGFRTKNVLHMFCAIPVYAMVFWLSLSLIVQDATPKQLFIERISCLVIFLSAIACICNYQDIHNVIPYGKSKNIFVRYLATLLFTFIVVFIEFVLMVFLSSIAS